MKREESREELTPEVTLDPGFKPSEERWISLDPYVKGRILQVLMSLKNKDRLVDKTLRAYSWALCGLAEIGDLDDVRLMETIIPMRPRYSQVRAAYGHYCRIHRLPAPDIRAKVDRRRRLPRIPSEKVLKASLAIIRLPMWRAYFRLLYEAGARPSEPFGMTVRDVNLDREMVRVGTLKMGGFTDERELPISPLLTGMIRELVKSHEQDDPIFHVLSNPRKPLSYKRAVSVMISVRNQLKAAGLDTRGLRLHGYRHAFATRLYTATKDLALVQRSLGHRDVRSTMIYIHIRPDQPRLYDVRTFQLGQVEEISGCIAEGWEKALQTAEMVWFRRPMWVP